LEGEVGRIGAHVSCSGGLVSAAERATAMGAECLQIFVGAPQNWASPRISEEEVDHFRAALAERRLEPLFVHAPYLVNLASLRPDVRSASRRALVEQLDWAGRLGALGAVIHVGSGGDDAMEQAIGGLREVLARHAGPAWLILENDAGSGRRIGRTFGEIGELIRSIEGDERVRVCVDTAHSLAAGYELRTTDGLDAAVAEIERELGLSRLALLHVNDSKVDLGRNVDRHENLGHGKLGLEAFARILTHPGFAHLPFVLEVPGYDGEGPDAPNVEALRVLATGKEPSIPAFPEGDGGSGRQARSRARQSTGKKGRQDEPAAESPL
jgi:deoxyribonuclease-4